MSRLDNLNEELAALEAEISGRERAAYPGEKRQSSSMQMPPQMQQQPMQGQQQPTQQQEPSAAERTMQQAEQMYQEGRNGPSDAERIINRTQRNDRNLLQNVTDVFTGNDRKTWESENLPSFYESGIINRLSVPKVQAITALSQITLDPREFGEIIVNLDPEDKFRLSEDPAGNVILNDTSNGKRAMINMPGFDSYDAVQGASQAAMYTPWGRPASIAGMTFKSAIPQLAKNMVAGGFSGPMSKKSILTQVAGQGLKDAGIQGAQELIHDQVGGSIDAGEIATAGLIGSAGTGLEHIVGAASPLWRNIKDTNPVRSLDDQRKIARSQRDIQLLKDSGFSASTSQVPDIHKATPFRESMLEGARHMPFGGEGDRLLMENKNRIKLANDFSKRYKNADEEIIYNDLKTGRQNIKSAIGKQLGDLRQDQFDVDMDLSPTIQEIDELSEKLKTTFSGKERTMTDDEKGIISIIDNVKENLIKDNKFGNFIREKEILGDSLDMGFSSGDNALNAAKKKLYRIMRNQEEDVIKTYNPDALEKYKLLNKKYSRIKKENEITQIKTVLDKGDIIPEQIHKVVNFEKSTMRLIYNSLSETGRKNMQNSIIGSARKKATQNVDNTFNEDDFVKYLNQWKDATDVFFPRADKKALKEFMHIMSLTKRQGSQYMSPQRASSFASGGMPINQGTSSPLATLLKMTGSSVGAAKAYESKFVRDAFMKFKAAKKGSSLRDRRLQDFRKAIITNMQIMNAGDQGTGEYYSPAAVNANF